MTQVSRFRQRASRLLGLAVCALAVACPGRRTLPLALVECPHEWEPYLDTGSTVVPGQISISGRATNIPEYHDCQRFIVKRDDGQLRYDSVFAIFGAFDLGARWDSVMAHPAPAESRLPPVQVGLIPGAVAPIDIPLDSVTQSPTRDPSDTTASPSGRSAWGFIEVYSDGRYPLLGIGPGFTCGYLYWAGDSLQLKMKWFGESEQVDCREPVDPDTLQAVVLSVVRRQHPAHVNADDYPAAARWDWDASNEIQHFGVKCGDAWCEVGPAAFVPSAVPALPAVADVPLTGSFAGATPAANWHRVRHVKGWYDQQRLAPATAANPTAPNPGWGTVFPDPRLDAYTLAQFRDAWVLSARVALDRSLAGYEGKVNLAPVQSDAANTNRIYLCWGTWGVCRNAAVHQEDTFGTVDPETAAPTCPVVTENVREEDRGVWWAGIVSATGNPRFRCVVRRDHKAEFDELGLATPGTARWRWLQSDETIWMSCDAGCCEVKLKG